MNQTEMIYTVTLIQQIDLEQINPSNFLPTFGDTRCVGFYHHLENAILAVTNNVLNIYENMYKYVVIEENPEGIFKYSKKRLIFEWKKDKYVQIDEPLELYQVCGFGIG